MALLVLALLGFAQAEVSASTASVSGGAGITASRQGDTAALLRVTGKTYAAEIRAGRPLPVKFATGNSGVLAPAVDFLVFGYASATEAPALPVFAAAPLAHANQPRAPPSA